MKKIIFFILLWFHFLALQAQEKPSSSPTSSSKPFFVDWVNGPYLFVDHTLYKSVYLSGVRLGYESKSGIGFALEYLAGQQHDETGELGTTHSAFGNLQYSFIKNNNSTRFRPYVLGGFGFFEFKDFSSDVLGVAFYLGAGTEINLSPVAKAFIEPRYVNLGPLDLAGKNELGIMWGIRARF